MDIEPTEPTIDSLVDDAVRTIHQLPDPASPEYTTAVNNLKTLKSLEPPKAQRPPVDPNVVIGGVFSLTSLISVLKYEQLHVLASKAFTLIPKLHL